MTLKLTVPLLKAATLASSTSTCPLLTLYFIGAFAPVSTSSASVKDPEPFPQLPLPDLYVTSVAKISLNTSLAAAVPVFV